MLRLIQSILFASKANQRDDRSSPPFSHVCARLCTNARTSQPMRSTSLTTLREANRSQTSRSAKEHSTVVNRMKDVVRSVFRHDKTYRELSSLWNCKLGYRGIPLLLTAHQECIATRKVMCAHFAHLSSILTISLWRWSGSSAIWPNGELRTKRALGCAPILVKSLPWASAKHDEAEMSLLNIK